MAHPLAMGRPFLLLDIFNFSSEDHHFATDYQEQYFHDRQTETLEKILGIKERERLRIKRSIRQSNVFTS